MPPSSSSQPAGWRQVLKHLEEGTLALTILSLSLMVFAQVVARYVFNQGFAWFEELSRYLGVFMTFLGASLGVKYGLHFSMDFFVKRVPPLAARAMGLVSAILGAALFLGLAWLGWQHCAKLMRFNTLSPALQMPMYWAYLPIPLFSLSMGLRFLGRAWSQLRPKEARA